ncbi:unnamed protein product [Linum tenue]|uniref:Protein FAM33A n=1 Tax=Linum tenue TaxID=586396 RepID=A0AAV0GUA7_9ROSI|nr:unnamed protein product [Linum tenue]CAI0376650.1 unnamed protein product [Linum tenue]
MGRDHHRNQAADGLVLLLMKAHHDLAAVQSKLEKEFQQTYPDNANPVKLVNRIKKIQEEVSGLKEQCGELLAAKQVTCSTSSCQLGFPHHKRSHQNASALETSNDGALTEYCEYGWFFGLFLQELVDKARTVLLGNNNVIQRMQVSTGISPTTVDEDPAFADFNQVIDEWSTQVRSGTGNDGDDSEGQDINQLLFSTIVQSND